MKRRIAIAGNGAWGQALAHVARTAGHDVSMWSQAKIRCGFVRKP